MKYILKLQDVPEKQVVPEKPVGRYFGKPLYYVDICDGGAYFEYLIEKAHRFSTYQEAFDAAARENATQQFKGDKLFVINEQTHEEVEIPLSKLNAVLTEWRAKIEQEGAQPSNHNVQAAIPAIKEDVDLHDEIVGLTGGNTTFFDPA